nr:telokin-like protein [Calliteara abietis nucleopolyhedrovirus]
MATNNNGTVNIAVYTILDKSDNNNTLSFIVQDEYHLKKLGVGAYSLNILDTRLLNDLSERACVTFSCGDYVVCHNFTDSSRNTSLNAILFNAKPLTLKKGDSLFKIVYKRGDENKNVRNNNKTTQHPQIIVGESDASSQFAKPTLQYNNCVSSNSVVVAADAADAGNKPRRDAVVGAHEARKIDSYPIAFSTNDKDDGGGSTSSSSIVVSTTKTINTGATTLTIPTVATSPTPRSAANDRLFRNTFIKNDKTKNFEDNNDNDSDNNNDDDDDDDDDYINNYTVDDREHKSNVDDVEIDKPAIAHDDDDANSGRSSNRSSNSSSRGGGGDNNTSAINENESNAGVYRVAIDDDNDNNDDDDRKTGLSRSPDNIDDLVPPFKRQKLDNFE